MKKVVLTIASILFAGVLTAQDYAPPPAAIESFKKVHPSITEVDWYDEENKIGCFFEENDSFVNAYFTTKGVWIRSEYSIEEANLPKPVLASLNSQYKGFEVSDVSKIVKQKETTYRIYIYNLDLGEDYKLTIGEGGQIIKVVDLNSEDSLE